VDDVVGPEPSLLRHALAVDEDAHVPADAPVLVEDPAGDLGMGPLERAEREPDRVRVHENLPVSAGEIPKRRAKRDDRHRPQSMRKAKGSVSELVKEQRR
jgi:hypothetical protein